MALVDKDWDGRGVPAGRTRALVKTGAPTIRIATRAPRLMPVAPLANPSVATKSERAAAVPPPAAPKEAAEAAPKPPLKLDKTTLDAQKAVAAARAKIAHLEKELVARVVTPDASALQAQLRQLKRELDVFKQAKQRAELATLDVRVALKEAEARVDKVRASPAYRLGAALIQGFSNWRDLAALPRALADWRRFRDAARADAATDILPEGSLNETAHFSELALARAQKDGVVAAEAWARDQRLRAPVLSRVLLELGKSVRRTDPAQCVALARAAAEADPHESRVRHLALMMMDAGAYGDAHRIMEAAVAAGAVLNGTEGRRREELLAYARLQGRSIALPLRASAGAPTDKPVVMIYATQSLPFHWSAASLRAHGLAQLLNDAGLETHVVTPPGYPPVKDGDAPRPPSDITAGVTYHRLPGVDLAPGVFDAYARASGAALALTARAVQAAAIVAPAEFGAAYTAGIASRAAGAALVLDAVSVEDRTDLTDYQTFLREAERSLLRDADGVLVRWPDAAAALAAADVGADRILFLADAPPAFAPDGVAPDWRANPALSGRFTLGYVGDPHEDLDLEMLPAAFDRLVCEGCDVALMVVGVGKRFNRLKEELDQLGHGARIVFPGRPRPGAIAAAFAGIDLVVAPARPGARPRASFEIANALAHGRPALTNLPAAWLPAAWRGACRCVEGDSVALADALSAIAAAPATLAPQQAEAAALAQAPRPAEAAALARLLAAR